jgi:hypothetical protein
MTAATPLTDQQYADIRTRHDNATAGHWYFNRGSYDDPNFVVAERHGYAHGVGSMDFGTGDEADADRDFVLNAHTDITALLAEVDRLRATIDHIEAWAATTEHRRAAADVMLLLGQPAR